MWLCDRWQTRAQTSKCDTDVCARKGRCYRRCRSRQGQRFPSVGLVGTGLARCAPLCARLLQMTRVVQQQSASRHAGSNGDGCQLACLSEQPRTLGEVSPSVETSAAMPQVPTSAGSMKPPSWLPAVQRARESGIPGNGASSANLCPATVLDTAAPYCSRSRHTCQDGRQHVEVQRRGAEQPRIQRSGRRPTQRSIATRLGLQAHGQPSKRARTGHAEAPITKQAGRHWLGAISRASVPQGSGRTLSAAAQAGMTVTQASPIAFHSQKELLP